MKAERLRGIVAFLGLQRGMVVLLTMVILVGLGEKMAERFLPIYILALGGILITLFGEKDGVRLAFVIHGLKEFGEPTRKALIMDLVPEGKKAGTFGAYYLARDIIVSVAVFGGAFLWNLSPAANFLTAFSFGLLGTLYFALFGKDLQPAEAVS